MRRNTFIKRALIAVMFLLSIISYSQNYVPFTTPRYDQDIRGDMFLIGNNILNRDTNTTNPNDPYTGTGTNNSDFDMNYIDVDSDATTFCSSSAQLVSPRPGGDNCYKIRYAGLYWAADLQSGSRTNINKVKFKLPTGGYIDITGTVVYDANPTPIGGDAMKPYACYADVTSLIAPLANPVGNYTVANVLASQGRAGGTGLAAGWTLFLVYEDPTLTSKSIVSFDGFSGIGGATTLTFPVTGFRTIPVGPVRAKFAMSALEGDRVLTGDYLRINGTTITTPERPGNNFFNATINTPAGPFTTRNPNSSNTLGYDASVLNVNNPTNSVIGNNVTTANIELGSTGDVYFYFFNAFAVDIIAPEIQLTKDVENSLGTPIGGANVNLGQQLNYVIGFQNIGNDNATSFTIKDVLPLNVIFNPADLSLPGALPPGVTFIYNAATREITFTIPNTLVEVGDPRFEISIRVHVVSTCMEMDDACSNLIQNQAFATYSGTFNTTVFSDEGSIASFGACGFGTPGSTNFLVGLDDCNFTRTEIKCGTTPLVLTAANGYQSYVWSGPGTITPVAGTNNQSVTVTSVGTYTVNDIINTSPCKSIVETINVVDFSASVTNPAIPVADQIVLCPTDGEQLPYIFLCSAGETQAIPTNIANATSITWQSLNVGSCAAVSDTRCANTNPACTWTTLSTAPNFTVNAAGQYRVIIIFQGGCQRTFYFNVYQNLISPTVATRDIICTNPGQITVNGVPPGYEYLLTPPGTTWQTSNIFPINTAGVYNVDIRQIGVTGGCVIPLSNIAIQARSMTVTATVTQPSCFPQKGSINLIANGVNPQYTYNIYQEPGHTLVNSVGPIAANNYLFSNLNSGNYSYQVTTPDGCLATGTFTINTLQPLSVTAALTIPLTCNDGEITIYPVGGTPPYSYFINSATVFQASPQYVVTAPGTYNIQVVDFNNCSATTSINVVRILPPAFNITKTDIACSSSGNTGTITVNVSNPNGNTLLYSINGAAGPFSSSPVFTNLPAGPYSVVVQYTAGTSQPCTTAPQAITIVAPTPIVGTATLTQTYDCTHPGIITVSGVSGGTGPYMYSIDGVTFQVGNTFTITSAGTYTISIRDANGCIITRGPIVVDALDGPRAVSITIHDVITCPSGTGTLNVNLIAGGLSPIRFRIVSPAAYATAYTSSGLFAGLPGGNTYCFEVIDRNGCTYQECYFFPPLPPFTVTGQVLNNVRCIGTSTGNGQFTVSGIPNSTNYSYQINSAPPAGINGTTPATGSSTFVINLTNVPAGSYTLTIHNSANNCDATQTIVITQPATALTANLTPSPLTCNGPATGQVVVNASGGWGGYTYTLTPPSGPVVGPQASNIFANLSLPGLYTVTTLDSGGCSVTSTFTLTGPVAPTAIISAASDFCYDGTNGATIIVTASGGVPPYTYTNNGGASQSSNTFGPLVPGTYNIVVTDSFGCTVALPTQTINPQLSIGASLTKDLDCNTPPNAVIAVNINGGYPTYQYQVNINGAGYGALISTGTPFNYSAASAGTYQFQVTDIRGCTAQSNVITINPLVPISATNAVTNVTCNGLSNGSVTITPSGGVAPYQINFNGAGFNTATTYSSLPAGTYNYIVRDTKNCTFNGSVTISQPAPIVGTATLTTQFTCTTSGVITVSGVGGGTSPYTYSMNGGPFGPATTFTITAAGTYTITIRDANGCTLVLAPIVVAPLSPPTDLSFAATALTCPSNTSNVTITVTGTNSPYIYEAIAPGPILAPQASNVFNNLPPGTYTFQVTDTKNCKYQENFTINPLPVLTVTGSVVSNVKCIGTSTGSIRFNVAGFSPNYSYVITGPPNSSAVAQTSAVINVPNLPAGTYTIVVTNPTTNCTATASVTITQPASALVAPVTVAPIRCGSLGQVTVNASGGWGGYTYIMVPMPAGVTLSGSTFSNIPAGSYSINTIDSGGCQAPTPFTLTNPSPPTASISAASDFCYDPVNSATIVVTASGGVPPYTYTNNGGASQTSNTFGPLVPGTYNIVVTDSFGCTVALPAQTINPQLSLITQLTKDLDCTLSPNAVISGTISNGYPAYTCLVNVNGGGFVTNVPIIAGNTFSYSTASAGTYQFLVTDSRGCTVQSAVYTINPLVPVAATHTQVNNTCFGATSGSVTITPSGGVAPYQINFNGLGFSATTTYSGLAAGTYNYIVRDTKSCTFNGSVTITAPTQIAYTAVVNPISCDPSGGPYIKGSICVSGLGGGVAPYTYQLIDLTGSDVFAPHNDPTGANYCFNNVDFGQYDLIVTDANGCTIIKSNLIMSNPPNDLTFVINPVLVSCAAGATVDVTLVGAIGPGPFEFGIVNLNAFPWSCCFVAASPGPLTHQFTGLTPGATYTIVVRDILTNCYYFEQMTASTPTNSTMTVSALVANPVPCRGGNNGSATFSLSGVNPGAVSVTYSIHFASNNVQVGAAVTIFAPYTSVTTGPLAPGTYNIQFTENGGANSGCGTTSATFTIVQSATDLTLSAITRNDNCNPSAGQIAPTAVGGTGPYTFQYLTTGSPAPTAASLAWTGTNPFFCDWGTYDVYVKDAYGCIKMITVVVNLDATPNMNATIASACAAEGAFAIDVTLPGAGIAPYTYIIDGSANTTLTAPFTISGLSSGSHSVQVQDFNGCGNTVILNILSPLGITPSVTALPSCANNEGQITVSATGGSGSYSYTLSNSVPVIIAGPQASNVFSGLAAGSYTVTVTDLTTLCTKNIAVVLSAPTPVTFTNTVTNTSCNGGSDGTITVNLTSAPDNPVYMYQITAPAGPWVLAPQTSNIFTGLPAGTYTVVVTPGRGCPVINNNVVVGQPSAVAIQPIATVTFNCAPNNTVNTASFTVVVLGGTAPYTYSIDNINYFTTNTFTISDTGATSLTVYVKDANGCTDTEVVTITPLPALVSATIMQDIAITCVNPEQVHVNVVGGSGSFSYQLLPSGAPQASNVFNFPTPGTYVIQVNDLTTNCYISSAPYTVAPFNTATVVATQNTAVTCFGNANGSININVSGYSGAYSYDVYDMTPAIPVVVLSGVGNTAVNPQPIVGLPAGNYTVQVTETASPRCVITSNAIAVNTPSAVVLTLISNVNAYCTSGAQVTVSGSGGTSPYTYAFVQNAVIPVPGNYTASNSAVLDPAVNTQWDVYVKDANGCTATIDVTIAFDPAPTISVPAIAADQCTSTGNSFTFTATGTGLAPLTYSIGTGFQSSGTFTVSTTGTYIVTIKDKNGCTATGTITIYPIIGITPSVTALPSCANNEGQITVSATGGSGSYSYTLSNSVPVIIAGPQASNVFSGLAAGSYTVTVTDLTTLCTKNIAVVLSAPTPVTFTNTVTNTSCNGGSDGTITVNLTSAPDNPVYTYQITAPVGPWVGAPQTTNVFTGLPAGTYTIVVTPGRGCPVTNNNVVVGQPTVVDILPTSNVTPFTCAANNSVNTALVTINVTGGTPAYTYSIDGINYFPTNTFTISDTGASSITVYVKDANGCPDSMVLPLAPIVPLNVSIAVGPVLTCEHDEVITITASGGSSTTYIYQTLPAGAANVVQNPAPNDNVFNISAPGTYYFQVTDGTTGCYIATLPVVIAPVNTITVVATPKTPVTCFSGTDGSIEILVSGYSGAYSYDVYDSTPAIVLSGTGNTTVANPQPISGLGAGNYTVQVTESVDPKCAVASNTVNVGSPTSQLTLIASESANVTCTNDQGIITALASGGWGTYEYELIAPLAADNVPFSSNNVFTGLSAGTYTINVRDLLGCPVSVPVTLVNPGIINATFLAAPALLNCYGDTNATITATVVSGGQVGNYTYTLHSGNPIFASSGPQVSPVFTGLGAGTYTVSITDGYNCGITSAPIVISEPQPIQAQLNVTTGVTCFTQATLTLTAQGGTAPYGYSTNVGGPFIPFNAGNSTTISVPVGLYNYYVNDINGCLGQSNNAQVDALQPLVFSTPSHTDILCPGSFGSISIEATGGLLNYVYTLYDTTGNPIVPAPTQTTPGNFTGLVAGSYIVHVLSGLDCTKDSAIITIAEPPTFVATPTPKDLKCNGVDDGSIHFDIVGGSGQFQYAIDPDIQQFFNIPSTGFDITGLGGPTTYHIIIRDGIHCPQEFDVFINEPAPVATTYGTHGNETCAELDDAYITINNITGGFAPYSVSYNLVGNTPSTPVVIPSFPYVIDNLNGGEYEITITDANGCPSYPPSVILDGGILYDPLAVPTFMCDANKKPMVIIKIINLSNPPSFNFVPAADYMFSIDDAVNAQQTSPIFSSDDWPNLLTPGTHIGYVFTATCPKETPPVTVNPADVSQLTLTLTHVELNQIIADVNNSGTAPYNYTFNGHDNGSNPIYVYDHAGTYHVIVTDSRNGCSAEADILVPFTPIFIPPVFTPDGNGEHDTWSPENTSNYKNLKTLIYDRYGRKVAELSEGQGWDGKYNEKELPTGDYWYVIKVDGNEDQEFVGHFTLYR